MEREKRSKIKWFRHAYPFVISVGLFLVILWQLVFGTNSNAALFSWMLFMFAWMWLIISATTRSKEALEKFNNWAGDDGLLLKLYTWFGIVGLFIAATVLLGLAMIST